MGTKNYSSYSDMITFSRASTGTYLDSDGLLKSAAINTPRVEYDYQGNRLGLLVEEARTNLLNYSNNPLLVDGGGVNSTTIGANTQADPAGTNTASLITATTVGGFFGPRYVSGTIGVVYTAWFIVKNSNSTRSRIYVRNSGDAADVTLNWSGATLSSTTDTLGVSTVKSLGGDYYKVAVTYTATEVTQRARFYPDNLDGDKSVILYAWQLETGSFPTSYIPTSGAAATRSADVASIGVGAFGHHPKVHTILLTAINGGVDNGIGTGNDANSVIRFGTGFVANYSSIGIGSSSFRVDRVDFASRSDGGPVEAVEYGVDDSFTNGQVAKVAAIFDTRTNVITGCVDNETIFASTGTNPIGGVDLPFTEMKLQHGQGKIHISSIAYYPRRLTDAQIKALTSPPETPTLSLTFDDSSTSYLETSIHG